MILPRAHQAVGWLSQLGSTTVTAPVATNTKTGAVYSELVAATTYEWHGFWLIAGGTGTSNTRTDILLDIAIGSAGNEVVILPDVLVGWKDSTSVNPFRLWVPLRIPRGSRISARCQAAISADTVSVFLNPFEGASAPMGNLFSGCDAYGITAASSQGTAHTPGSTGAFSAAANIGGTASKNYSAVMLLVQGTTATTVMADANTIWRLETGAVRGVWNWRTVSTELIHGPIPPMPLFIPIPSGTQMKVSATRTDAAGQSIDCALYAFY